MSEVGNMPDCWCYWWWGRGPKRHHAWWWLGCYLGAIPVPPPPPGHRLPWWPYPHPSRDPREELEYLRSYKEALERDLKELQDELRSVEERIKELEEKLKK